MSRVAIQVHADGIPVSTETFAAYDAFVKAGWDVSFFQAWPELPDDREIVVVGGIANVSGQLKRLGCMPSIIDYPIQLWPWMVGTPGYAPLARIRRTPTAWPLFVKPAEDHKLFTGLVIRSENDLLRIAHAPDEAKCWFVADWSVGGSVGDPREWRVFFLRGLIVDIRPYCGPIENMAPDTYDLEKMLAAWDDKPIAGSIDVATFHGEPTPTLVEVNDAWSLGSYGLYTHLYAEMIVTRWAEMTKTDMSW